MCAAKINIGEVTPNEGRVACDGVTPIGSGKIAILKPFPNPGFFQICFSKRAMIEMMRHKRTAKFHSIKAAMRKPG